MEAERRQVTVLFTDMVGFTTFSERSGEEVAFTLMRSLSKLMHDAVCEQGGAVQSFTGDGIMAVFGAPVALEDAPELPGGGLPSPSPSTDRANTK
jgi:class 3 adenylate cyclase